MKFGIINIGDIHIDNRECAIYTHRKGLAKSIANASRNHSDVILAVNGDIAYSGAEEEYEIAWEIFEEITTELKKLGIKFYWILSPGNHDCNHSPENQIRSMIIKQISSVENLAEDTINQCTSVQKNFRSFRDMFERYDLIKLSPKSNELHREIKIMIADEQSIQVDVLNSSWTSQRNEIQGKLTPPKHNIKKQNANFSFVLSHHPDHWFNNEEYKKYQKEIEQNTNLILTGHEHTSDSWEKKRNSTNSCYILQGNVLEDSRDNTLGGFQFLSVDLTQDEKSQASLKITNFKWSCESLLFEEEDSKEISLNLEKDQSNSDIPRISNLFKEELNNTGMTLHDGYRRNLTFFDLYIPPHLNSLDDKADVFSLENLLSTFLSKKVLVTGDEFYGKSSLLKYLYKEFFDSEKAPLLINLKSQEAKRIRTIHDLDDFIKTKYNHQTDSKYKNIYDAADKDTRILLVDNLDHASKKLEALIFEYAEKHYGTVIYTSAKAYEIESRKVSSANKKYYDELSRYELLEFGHKKRLDLVKRWESFSKSQFESDSSEFLKNIDKKVQLLQQVVSNNYIDSLPIFLLASLRAASNAAKTDLTRSSLSGYYDFLLRESLQTQGVDENNWAHIESYLRELAYYILSLAKENQEQEISANDLKSFNQQFAEKYNDELLDIQKRLNIAYRAGILVKNDDLTSFQYSYALYNLSAQYIKSELDKDNQEIKARIIDCCKNIQHRENANIVSFLVHHSQKPFILDEVLKAADRTISKAKEIHLVNNELNSIEKLVTEMPKIALKDKTKHEVRAETAETKDDFERRHLDNEKAHAVLNDVTLTLRILEIIGHIIKENSHSLKSEQREKLCHSAYNLAMRLFGYFVVDIESNSEELVKELQEFIAKKSSTPNNDKLQSESRKIVFHIVNAIGFASILELTKALALPNLKRTFDDILKNNETSRYIKLANVALNLECCDKDSFPMSSIKDTLQACDGSLVSKNILRGLVIRHLYLFDVGFQTQQKVCALLDIGDSKQKQILLIKQKAA